METTVRSCLASVISQRVPKEIRDRVFVFMLMPRVGNVEVQAHTGVPSILNANRILTVNTRGRHILSAAVSPVSAQSEGHRYRLLLEVKHATIAFDSVIILVVVNDIVQSVLLRSELLYVSQRARECTYRHPEGQLHGRQGRRSVLEDGVPRPCMPSLCGLMLLTLHAPSSAQRYRPVVGCCYYEVFTMAEQRRDGQT